MVAVTGTVPVFRAVNDPMLPVPLAASPMLVVVFVQLNPVAPAPLNVMTPVLLPEHNVWSETANTEGVGLTVIVKVWAVPVQVTRPKV
jgi:hypothetical protein